MSVKKKIILSFLVSSTIIAILSAFLMINFVEIKNETVFLELTDTIRSKSLQLRRHEKNYFLYAPAAAEDESRAIFAYLQELDDILGAMRQPQGERLSAFKGLVAEYRRQFEALERLVATVSRESDRLKTGSAAYGRVSKLIEANFLDKPLEDVGYLQQEFRLASDHLLVASLRELDTEISGIRKTGENILTASKELDKAARDRVDRMIRVSRTAILIFFPLFLVVGFGTVIYIVGSVVRRLQLITVMVEQAGRGAFTHVAEPADAWGSDEVGQLIRKFNSMEDQLEQREKELLQSKKLAAIGTLAAGVAHELNNPLNNIYTTAQRLMKKKSEGVPAFIERGIDDIFSQTMRVKGIVGDLLAFARGREPHHRPIELGALFTGVYAQVGNTRNTEGIRFSVETHPREIVLYADPEQLEQVFTNLFVNAIDAMNGEGGLSVRAEEQELDVVIRVSDTGRGLSPENIEMIFEPFYTTKDKGTGLGLAIAFNIIQKHHGRITVESPPGGGATFIVTLPKAAAGGEGGERHGA